MSSLGFPSYSTGSVTSASSRKFHEGNVQDRMSSAGQMSTYSTANEVSGVDKMSSPNVSTSTAYPYFTSPGTDLYGSTSPYSANSSATGVFSSRTLQPTRPRSKSRANAGKIRFSFYLYFILVMVAQFFSLGHLEYFHQRIV